MTRFKSFKKSLRDSFRRRRRRGGAESPTKPNETVCLQMHFCYRQTYYHILGIEKTTVNKKDNDKHWSKRNTGKR